MFDGGAWYSTLRRIRPLSLSQPPPIIITLSHFFFNYQPEKKEVNVLMVVCRRARTEAEKVSRLPPKWMIPSISLNGITPSSLPNAPPRPHHPPTASNLGGEWSSNSLSTHISPLLRDGREWAATMPPWRVSISDRLPPLSSHINVNPTVAPRRSAAVHPCLSGPLHCMVHSWHFIA